MPEAQILSATMTGEPYQPARLYYQVFQKHALLGRFKRLRCIEFDPPRSRWVWLYTQEAKNLKFERSYQSIPKSLRPIVLGSFTFPSDNEMLLDVRSFQRATQAIVFFDQKINRRLAKVSKIRIVNKLFPLTENLESTLTHPSIFFDRDDVEKPKELMGELLSLAEQYTEVEDRREAAFSYLQKQMKKALPEVEELEIHFYEDGIEPLKTSLKLRQIEALEHWKGNKNFSRFDMIKKFVENFEDEEL